MLEHLISVLQGIGFDASMFAEGSEQWKEINPNTVVGTLLKNKAHKQTIVDGTKQYVQDSMMQNLREGVKNEFGVEISQDVKDIKEVVKLVRQANVNSSDKLVQDLNEGKKKIAEYEAKVSDFEKQIKDKEANFQTELTKHKQAYELQSRFSSYPKLNDVAKSNLGIFAQDFSNSFSSKYQIKDGFVTNLEGVDVYENDVIAGASANKLTFDKYLDHYATSKKLVSESTGVGTGNPNNPVAGTKPETSMLSMPKTNQA